MSYPTFLRIASRQSILALAQTEIVRLRLLAAHPLLQIEVVPMVTTGDRNTHRSLADIGGKGLFTKELEEALLGGTVDMAVHSLKDMETHLHSDLMIAAVLEREDARDVLIAPEAKTLTALKPGATVGTSSMRRAAQVRMVRPDLRIIPFRGNVTTRIIKIKNGEVDATLLALAGLKRIHMENEATEILDTQRFIPAAGQGIIAIECKRGRDDGLYDLLQHINHEITYTAMLAERSLLATLDGSCRTPIGGYACMEGAQLRLDAMVAMPDGSFHVTTRKYCAPAEAARMGQSAATELLQRGGSACLT